MVEGEAGKVDLGGGIRGDEVLEGDWAGYRRRGGLPEVGNDDRPLDGGEPLQDAGDLRQGVVGFAAVGVAVGDKEQPGTDLPETVDAAAHAEVRRGGGHDRADGSRRKRDGDGLGDVGKQEGDPVARFQAGRAHGLDDLRNEIVQLPPAEFAVTAALVARDDRGGEGSPAQEVFGEIEPRVGEVAGLGEMVAVLDHPPALVAHDAAPVPRRVPQGGLVLDRPAPQRLVVAAHIVALCRQRGREAGEAGGVHAFPRGGPEGGWPPRLRHGSPSPPSRCAIRLSFGPMEDITAANSTTAQPAERIRWAPTSTLAPIEAGTTVMKS